MSVEIIDDKLKNLKTDFLNAAKRIIRKDVSSNQATLNKNRDLLIAEYNKFLEFAESIYPACDVATKDKVIDNFNHYREKLLQAFAVIRCNYKIHTKLFTRITSDILTDDFTDPFKSSNMEKANLEYLKLANNILKSYNGKPEGLASFLNCLDLLKTITPPELTSLALSFIKTRLEGRALDSIPQSYVSIDELKVALTNNIKPISSKLLESRLSATSSSKKTLQEFIGAIENAASLLKQSLVTEGCSSKKAEELVTARVLEICRSSTQSEFLKTVLASSTFNNYQDVINKYCLESTQSGLNNNTSVLLMQRSYRSAVPGSNFRYQNPHNFNYSNAGLSRFNTPNYQNQRQQPPMQNRNTRPSPNYYHGNRNTNDRFNYHPNNHTRYHNHHNNNHSRVQLFQTQGNE